MVPDLRRLALRPPFAAVVLVLADLLFFLGADADHRISRVLVIHDLPADVPELLIAVRVLPAFQRLDVALQAEALRAQQAGDRVSRYPPALPGQLRGQRAG
jgi:hypothetical protein